MRPASPFAKLGSIAGAIVAVVAIGMMGRLHLGYDGKIAPFLVPGRVGEPVTTRSFELTVQSVRLARALTVAGEPGAIEPPPLTTSGVWLVVRARVAARAAPVHLMSVRLHGRDGDDYSVARSRLLAPKYTRWMINENSIDAGIPREGLLVFELPPARVAGVRLRVADAVGNAALDHLTDIDLGIDEARLQAMQRDIADVLTIGKDMR